METFKKVPQLAADLLKEDGWGQGQFTDSDDKRCLHGSVMACTPQVGDRIIVSAFMHATGHDFKWNDHKERLESEVLNYLTTLQITDTRLADVFGPQWAEWVDMMRVVSGWPGLVDAAVGVAAVAVDAAVADAAGAVWWRVSWLIRRTSLGLLTRHKIGEADYTQNHYDILTSPWRTHIGSIHADDKNLLATPE